MAEINLDQKRAERQAAQEELNPDGHTVTFRGEKFRLPAEPAYDVAEAAYSGNIGAGVRKLLVPEDVDRFFELGPSVYDVQELAKAAAEIYGFGSPGESQASAPSSKSTSRPSRPISSPTG